MTVKFSCNYSGILSPSDYALQGCAKDLDKLKQTQVLDV